MGQYITQSDLEAFWGTANIAKWSNKDNDSASTASTTAVAAAILEAEADIDDAFRSGPYSIPFSPVPAKVKAWVVRLAGAILYQSRGMDDSDADNNKLKTIIDIVKNEMRSYLANMATFNAGRKWPSPSGPTVIRN